VEVRGLVFWYAYFRLATNNNGEEFRWSRGSVRKRDRKLLESGGFCLSTIPLIYIDA
jgi:hypothetical protein